MQDRLPRSRAAAGVKVFAEGLRVEFRKKREGRSRQRKPVRPTAWRCARGWRSQEHVGALPSRTSELEVGAARKDVRVHSGHESLVLMSVRSRRGAVFKHRRYSFWQWVASVLGKLVPGLVAGVTGVRKVGGRRVRAEVGSPTGPRDGSPQTGVQRGGLGA